MRHFLVSFGFLLALLTGDTLAGGQRALAQTAPQLVLEAPQGEVILRVGGQVARLNDGAFAAFDLAMLQAMEPVSFDTGTVWLGEVSHFEGVSLKSLLREIGAEGRTLRLTALNDYVVDIPVESLEEDVPILAYAVNGKILTLRDKGPLWVMYPFDRSTAYQTEALYIRSVWQLEKIEVLP